MFRRSCLYVGDAMLWRSTPPLFAFIPLTQRASGLADG